jgi:hypothetical protein
MTNQTHKTTQTTQSADQQGGYARAKDSAADAARRASEGIEANPLAVVAGGLAVGAIAGALLPRSAKEKELLAPVGKRLGDTARQAFAAAREAGTQELDGAGLTPSAARDRGKELLGGLGKAFASAGAAAAQAAKQGQAKQADAGQTDQAAPGGFDAQGDALPTSQA